MSRSDANYDRVSREAAAIAAAILKLGGRAMPPQIAAASGLDARTVANRLRANGPANCNPGYRFFTRREGGWGLTPAGAELGKAVPS